MEEPPPMNQPTMEENLLTCTTYNPGPGNLTFTTATPNPTMMPMLHQATPDNLEEFTDEGTQKDHPKNKDSEKDPTNGKNTEKENMKNREDQQTKFMENTALDNVLVDDNVKKKSAKNKAIQPTWFPSRAVLQKRYQ
jgi:hypothetical protein